ncbi:MAG: DUF1707 domain-containing protein [Nocardioides sp.]
MTTPGNERLRISDADRDRAAAHLGDHFAEGRLTADEHAERLDAVWTARTSADLAPLFSDLPGRQEPQPSGGSRRPWGLAARASNRRGWVPLLPALAVLIVLSVITHLPFWILIFFIGCGAFGRSRHGWDRHPA